MKARGWLRCGLIVLAVSQGLAGVVQLLAPRTFYDNLPWVALTPPYSEHLMRDVGALTLAFVLVLVVAAVTMNPLVVRTGLAANLVFTLPHFVCPHHPPGHPLGDGRDHADDHPRHRRGVSSGAARPRAATGWVSSSRSAMTSSR